MLDVWNNSPALDRPDLENTIAVLRTALTRSVRNWSENRGRLRANTKRALVLTLLRRPQSATAAQVAEATSWATHTVRGFFAGLDKAGTPVTILEQVRQVGARQAGAKGSYTVYRVPEAG